MRPNAPKQQPAPPGAAWHPPCDAAPPVAPARARTHAAPSPTIASCLTPQHAVVQADDSIGTAREMLLELGIRYLPVLDGKQLVGLVTARDLALAANRVAARVEDVMTPCLAVAPDTPLESVLDEMTARQLEVVVVMEERGSPAPETRVAGIFSGLDAIRALRDRLARVSHGARPARETP